MKPSPSRLEPIFSLRPWGVRSLAPLFPDKSNLDEPVGEAWLTGLDCRFANGPFAGKKLGEAWREMPAEWIGTALDHAAGFPLLVKFLFTQDKLSVQVHPDDDYAAREEAEGERGKTEMWCSLRAEPGAEVLVGLDPKVTLEEFRRAIANGTAENCLQHIPIHPGDVVFVPARTPHTIGAGLVLCEIQQYSDLTYRVYDYNRRDANGSTRELHVEKALEVMQFGEQSGGRIVPVRIERDAVTETYFLACRYFAAEKWEFGEPVAAASSHEHFDLLIFLEGGGSIECHHEHFEYAPAQAWLIPAALGAYQLTPRSRSSLLRTYVPTDMNEFVRRLEERGVSKESWSKLIYP